MHTVAIVRNFYTAVAKSVHTPARRREEPQGGINLGAKAASLALAVVLKGNLDYQVWACAVRYVLCGACAVVLVVWGLCTVLCLVRVYSSSGKCSNPIKFPS